MRNSTPPKKCTRTEEKPKQPFYHPPLVEKKPLSRHVACFFGPQQQHCRDALKTLTGKSPSKPRDLDTTPAGKHLKPDENGVCGHASDGSELIYSKTKAVKFVETSPAGKKSKTLMMYLLTRKQDYVPQNPKSALKALCANSVVAQSRMMVKATPATRKSQVRRSQLKSQNAVMGHSARVNAVNYFAKHVGGDIPQSEIEMQIWHWCHGLSCAISQNAIAENGNVFNPQTKENLHVGTCVFNKNMMRIENPVLELLNKVEVKVIEYAADHLIFTNSHVLKSITLNINIMTHDHRSVAFDYSFSADENREFSHEFTTVLYATLLALVRKPDCAVKLTFE